MKYRFLNNSGYSIFKTRIENSIPLQEATAQREYGCLGRNDMQRVYATVNGERRKTAPDPTTYVQ